MLVRKTVRAAAALGNPASPAHRRGGRQLTAQGGPPGGVRGARVRAARPVAEALHRQRGDDRRRRTRSPRVRRASAAHHERTARPRPGLERRSEPICFVPPEGASTTPSEIPPRSGARAKPALEGRDAHRSRVALPIDSVRTLLIAGNRPDDESARLRDAPRRVARRRGGGGQGAARRPLEYPPPEALLGRSKRARRSAALKGCSRPTPR